MTTRYMTSFMRLLGLVILFTVVVALPEDAFAKSTRRIENRDLSASVTEVVDPDDQLIMADAGIVSAQDMGEMRGGFIDASGFIYKFAVDVKSHIDGALMFVRSLVLETGHNGHGFQVASTSQVMTENLPQGATADVLKNGAGVVVSSDEGKTTMINQPSSGIFSSVILNAADNRNISQTVNIDLVLQNVNNSLGQLSALRTMNAPASLFQSARMHSVGFGL